jgi:DNA-binding CsgD family transcriptional regulator
MEQEGGKERARLGTTRRDVNAAVEDLESTKDPVIHARATLRRRILARVTGRSSSYDRRITVALPPRPRLRSMAMEAGLRRLRLREARVARLVAEGLSDEQVAERLGITVPDVSADLAEVFRKLGLRSRTELALLAPDGPPSRASTDEQADRA